MKIDHIVCITKNIPRTKKFYSLFLGKPHYTDKYSVSYVLGRTQLWLVVPWKKAHGRFDLNRVGLNHIAFGVRDRKELERMQRLLDTHGIKNKGIRKDTYGGRPYLWFFDPNGIGLEFYLRK